MRSEILDFFSPPPAPDAAAINSAVDSAFVVIAPQDVSSTAAAEDTEVARDRVVLPRGTSVLRANLTITRAVEKAGGTVLYGIESVDSKRHWQTVTLGISAGDSLIREVMLVSRVR